MIPKILLIFVLIISIESRQSLHNYIVSQNNLNRLDYSVYDPLKKDLLYRLESLNNVFNPSSDLILYPSQQTIASIRNIWSPFCNIYFQIWIFFFFSLSNLFLCIR